MEQSQKLTFTPKNTKMSPAFRIASSPTPYYSSSPEYAILLYESLIKSFTNSLGQVVGQSNILVLNTKFVFSDIFFIMSSV